MNQSDSNFQLVVSVGTDHHIFDRLIDWVDDWIEGQESAPSLFVQHGASRSPRNGVGQDRLPRAALLKIYENAQVVVVQGGPGSILDVREVGVVPIAVPRAPELKEVVDGHQIEFTKVMAKHGNAIFVDQREDLHRQLDQAFADPQKLRTEPRVAAPQAAGEKLAEQISQILASPQPRTRRVARRIRQLIAIKRVN